MSAAQRYWLVLSVLAGPACTSTRNVGANGFLGAQHKTSDCRLDFDRVSCPLLKKYQHQCDVLELTRTFQIPGLDRHSPARSEGVGGISSSAKHFERSSLRNCCESSPPPSKAISDVFDWKVERSVAGNGTTEVEFSKVIFCRICGFQVRVWESYRTSRSFGYGYESVT